MSLTATLFGPLLAATMTAPNIKPDTITALPIAGLVTDTVAEIVVGSIERPGYIEPEPTEATDRKANPNWWLNRLKAHDLNLADSTVIYPKFMKFCVNVYNWGDEFFNGTDHEYVVGTGTRWKARFADDNWADTYMLRLPDNLRINMLSDVYSNAGAYIQYMALSLGYSYDMSTLFGINGANHKKLGFGFNCARFNIELFYNENDGGTHLHKFGDYKDPDHRHLDLRFEGVELSTWGVTAAYFLNHRRYSHGAAYNFSKFQRRSQGSWLVGFSYTNLKMNFDFSQLPPELLPLLTVPAINYKIHYDSYAAIGGYAYNWVIAPRWLYNITVAPSLGLSHCYEDSEGGEKWMFSANFSARTSLTYNFGRRYNWFLCAYAKLNGSWYRRGTFSIFSSIINFSATVGIRF